MDASKRKLEIDPDTSQEVSGGKRARVEQNLELKEKVLLLIGIWYVYLHEHMFGASDEHMLDISASIHLMNILSSYYTILRQRAQGKTGITERNSEKSKITAYLNKTKYEKDGKGLLEFMEYSASKIGLSFNKTTHVRGSKSSSENWYGIAGPYLNLLSGFGSRLKEIRLGHQEVVFGKEEGRDKVVHISKFGLNRSHCVLLEGCRMPPERRSSMVQSMGPMTVLISYLKATQGYTEKLKEAVLRAFAHIPYMDTILGIIKGKNYSEITGVINALADISIMITTRQASRAFPPANIFFNMIIGKAVLKQYVRALISLHSAENTPEEEEGATAATSMVVDSTGAGPSGSGSPPAATQAPVLAPEIKNRIKNVNFSGAGAFMLYKDACKIQWRFTSRMDKSEAAQIIFHCWMGTYREDIGILREITTTNDWVTREMIGDKFKGMNTEGTTDTITLVQMTKYSKLSTASQTGLLAQSAQHLSALPVFSGQRRRKFTEDLVKAAKKNIDRGQAVYSDVGSVLLGLNKIRTQLAAEIEENGFVQNSGYVKWANMTDLTWQNLGTDGWAPTTTDERFDETGVFFA